MNVGCDDIDFTQHSLNVRDARRTYLVTCSQVDLAVFPTRESFGQCVANNFVSKTISVLHWACCLEQHEDGGSHYHMAIKLNKPRRWKAIKDNIQKTHGAVLNFSESHHNYYSAYKYICKSDKDIFKSLNHPNLDSIGSPKTSKCIKVYRNKRKQTSNNNSNEQNPSSTQERNSSNKNSEQNKASNKIKRLSNLDVSEFIAANNIKNLKQLYAIAHERKEEGNKDLASFILSRSTKSLTELLTHTWEMATAKNDLVREQTSRIDILKAVKDGQCVENCNGLWLECAKEVLTNNRVHPIVFSAALSDLLTKGRGKFRNIMIVGPANCGKTFLLLPLQKIFKTFCNPSNDKYAWLGVESAEVIFLNDFRWSSEMISWKEFLLLLEGQPVHLPTPKNNYCTDICVSTDIPIFATGKSTIKFIGRGNKEDPKEDEMMAVRWKVFEFFHQIEEREQKDVPSCEKCFAELVLCSAI